MSGQTTDCPWWEYKEFPAHATILPARSRETVLRLRSAAPDESFGWLCDTRPAHRAFFTGLTPANNSYYAGNYRGDPKHICLEHFVVRIESDPRVGCPPARVKSEMIRFEAQLREVASYIEVAAVAAPAGPIDQATRVTIAVQLAVHLFIDFLTIHPYINGNGHVARLLLIVFLGRHGIWMTRFDIDPRPDHPQYDDMIGDYRSGVRGPLENFVMSCIAAPRA